MCRCLYMIGGSVIVDTLGYTGLDMLIILCERHCDEREIFGCTLCVLFQESNYSDDNVFMGLFVDKNSTTNIQCLHVALLNRS